MAMFFNESQINDWNFGDDNIIKVYKNNAVCYNKINTSSPTPPTPTYQWVSYNEGDTVPTKLVYGVKLYLGSEDDYIIMFGDYYSYSGVYLSYDTEDWHGVDLNTWDDIDLSSYYDSSEGCYIVLFSALGYGGLPISDPQDQFEFNIDLYEKI